jgi:hypothetical protein
MTTNPRKHKSKKDLSDSDVEDCLQFRSLVQEDILPELLISEDTATTLIGNVGKYFIVDNV